MVKCLTWNHHTGWYMLNKGRISVFSLAFTSGASGPLHSLLLQAVNHLLVCINQSNQRGQRRSDRATAPL